MDAVDSARFLRPPAPQRSGGALPLVVACAVCALLATQARHDRLPILWAHALDAAVAPAQLSQAGYPALSLDLARAHRTRNSA